MSTNIQSPLFAHSIKLSQDSFKPIDLRQRLDQHWARLSTVNLALWADEILDWFAMEFGILSGSMYLKEESILIHLGSYALDPKAIRKTYTCGEGWVGQAAVSQRALIVNPPVKFSSDSFQSTLVSIEPQTIAYFPLTFNENKLGVLELAWPDYKSASEIELTSDAIETLCARLFHVISQQKITSLYEEAQDKSAQLEEKESSLRQYITELEEAQLLMGRMQDSLEDTVKQRTSELENTLIELKAAQNQIVQSEKLASLGQLVAGVAHEINTPIGIAVTAASYLQTNTDELNEAFSGGKMKKSDFEDYLEQARECSILILKNLERASQLIQSFKKVAVNQSSENVYEFDLGEYLNEILTSLRPQLRKTRVEYDVDCPEELLITSSSSAISQIVINLVMNSLLHAFDPNQQGLLSIVVEDKGKKAMIRYSDNGKGIPHDIIDKIFDPFFTTRRGSGGSGLGLNIVHNLASQMLKGSVRCTSELGKGTSFFIEFPKQIQ